MPGPTPLEDGEDAGLRAFELRVGAHAGAFYPERPEWVELDGRRLAVTEVESTWREEERVGFRVRLETGVSVLLYYVPNLDLWSGVPFADTTPGRGHGRRRPA